MQTFEYKGKRYIKIKQDWYSDIGEKQPLKMVVELDAVFSDSILSKEEDVKTLLNQSAHFQSTGINQKALDYALEALKMAEMTQDRVQLPVALVKSCEIYRLLKQFDTASYLIAKTCTEWPDVCDQPSVTTMKAIIACDQLHAKEAIELAELATSQFRLLKKKSSDELLIVWNRIKASFPDEYQQYKVKKQSSKDA